MLTDNEEAVCDLLLSVEADIDSCGGTQFGITAYVWYRPAMAFPWTLGIEHEECDVCHISCKDAAGVLETWKRCGLTDVQRIVSEMAARE